MQNKKITLFITMIFIIIIIIVAIFYNKPLSPPERIGDIPINAFWVGGSDGGLWYEFFTNNDSIYHFRIYNDLAVSQRRPFGIISCTLSALRLRQAGK